MPLRGSPRKAVAPGGFRNPHDLFVANTVGHAKLACNMPCIEISLPRIEREAKSRLAAELTEAFCSSTGHPAEIFGLRFFEYAPEAAAQGGKLCSSGGGAPYLHMLVYCPRLRRSVKQKLGSALSEAFTRALGNPTWVPVIHICEHPFDNVVVGGKLLSDAYEECARRSFYYELPKD